METAFGPTSIWRFYHAWECLRRRQVGLALEGLHECQDDFDERERSLLLSQAKSLGS